MKMTNEIKSSFLNVQYIDCIETLTAYDYTAWKDYLASIESNDLKDVAAAGNLKDWWTTEGCDPEGYGSTMTYHSSILDEIENGMTEFNQTAPRYLGSMSEVIDVQLGSETAKVIIKLENVSTDMETDDLELVYADEIKYRFSIPTTAGIGFVDKANLSLYYIEFKNDCLKSN